MMVLICRKLKKSILILFLLVSVPLGFSSPIDYVRRSIVISMLTNTDDCTFKGIALHGKVKVVSSFPDIKIKVVTSFPDIKVKWVQSFPDDCGEWQMVESFPDFTIQFVESFPDLEVEFVESFPGMN